MKRSISVLVSVAAAVALVGCGGSSDNTTPPPPPPDTMAPTASFNPATLTVASGATGNATVTATDNVAVTTGPDVTCTNGGAFSGTTFTAPTTTTDVTSVCTATAGDAAGNSGTGVLTVTVTGAPPSVNISGAVTFDFVPHDTGTNGLDYDNTVERPAAGVVVEALDSMGIVLATTNADANGNYFVTVDSVTDVRIRAKAQLLRTTAPNWNVKVTDNTSLNSLYALDGSLTSSGAADSTRNLRAGSGWGGTAYTGTRAAAPFAILAPVYNAIQDFAAVDNAIVFPPLELRWSANNKAVAGDRTIGEIGTSFYQSGNIYLLGDADNDTDEYDKHVVTHEWGHYFEDNLSRSDSIGGRHGSGDRLDPRVALGEGFGNALSAMVLDDPVYRDSLGGQQSGGFSINIESNTHTNEGWFNEGTVQSIMYDLYDSNSDGTDTLSLGLGPIYQTLTSNNYTSTPVFMTIFAFLTEFKLQAPGNVAAIDTFTAAQSVSGTGVDGSGEAANGSIATALPVFKPVTVNGGAVQICSVDDAGEFNKLGNRAFVTFTAAATGSHTLTMTRTSGPTSRDPDFFVFQGTTLVARAESPSEDIETLTQSFSAGDYVIDAHDFLNVDTNSANNSDICFNFTIAG